MSLTDRINSFVSKSEKRDTYIRQKMNEYLTKIPRELQNEKSRESRLYRGYLKIKENMPKDIDK